MERIVCLLLGKKTAFSWTPWAVRLHPKEEGRRVTGVKADSMTGEEVGEEIMTAEADIMTGEGVEEEVMTGVGDETVTAAGDETMTAAGSEAISLTGEAGLKTAVARSGGQRRRTSIPRGPPKRRPNPRWYSFKASERFLTMPEKAAG